HTRFSRDWSSDVCSSDLQRLVSVLARSALLGERLAAHPLLLDELLDVRVSGNLPGRDALIAACDAALAQEDPEAALLALNETRQIGRASCRERGQVPEAD